MKQQPLVVALIILALLGVVLWAAHTGWHGFSIEHKLNVVDLATLAVTIFIAYFLQYYFVSRATDTRSEKVAIAEIWNSPLQAGYGPFCQLQNCAG